MGKDNRARRAAKQRKRAQESRRADQRTDRTGPSPLFLDVPEVAMSLAGAARATMAGDTRAAEDAAFAAVGHPSVKTPRRAQKIMVDLVADAMGHLWQEGWQPLDLHEVTRRQLTAEHVGVLAAIVAHAMQPFATATVDPRWLAQLTPAAPWTADSNALEAWQRAERKDAVWSITLAVELLAVVLGAPRLEKLMAPPGSFRGHRDVSSDLDQKVLARVRALLAKAESTEFDEEAEALSAKAQELMTRHSLDRLLVDAPVDEAPLTSAVRIWLETPYVSAKSLLVSAVAGANLSTAIWNEQLGFVTVVGDAHDLAATELMVTSLLVQAGRAMLHASQRSDQKRSFRQSFLVSYASRVGERLDQASAHATAELGSTALVPALAAHHERVDRAREQLFPRITSRSVAVSNAQGWAAGRAAADQAELGGNARLTG
jgi:hypothetical protein